MKKSLDIAETEYIRAFTRWEYTNKWSPLRWFRKRQYEFWLRAMLGIGRRERERRG